MSVRQRRPHGVSRSETLKCALWAEGPALLANYSAGKLPASDGMAYIVLHRTTNVQRVNRPEMSAIAVERHRIAPRLAD